MSDHFKRILVALDVSNADDARRIVEPLQHSGLSFGVKIGMELACAAGHRFIREMAEEDIYIFDDQKRFTTPAEAIRMGADWLVIGRPVTDSRYGSPVENLSRILDEVAVAA